MLLLVTLIAFSPAFHGGFVTWDDPNYVTKNRLLDDASGLVEIWSPSSPRLPEGGLQYYPLVFTSFWIEHRLWGGDARGYHATNVALHVANVALALLVVQRLGAPFAVALGAAAVFALHPTQVASVAWVSERKNVLSGLFYLLSFLLYLRHRRTKAWGAYAASLAAFGAALLSKSQTATLPVVLFLAEWLVLPATGAVRRMPLGRVGTRLAPMALMGIAAAAVTSRIERQVIASFYDIPALAERPLVAASAAWFYVGKFLLPVQLSPLYPRWLVDLGNPWGWLALAAWAAVLVGALRWRRKIAALPLWGMALFFVSVAPALGFVPFAYQHRSLVADHFLYLSCLGGGVALAALGERIAARGANARRGVMVGALTLVSLYAVQTHREARHWASDFTFWKHVLAANPDAYPANVNLAREHHQRGELDDAIRLFRKASELRPLNVFALEQYLDTVQSARGNEALARACTESIERGSPLDYRVRLYRARAFEALGRTDEAIVDYEAVMAKMTEGSPLWREARSARDRLRTQR